MAPRPKKIKVIEKRSNAEMMAVFTIQQLEFCYDALPLYPEIQEQIQKLTKKLKQI